MALEKVKLHAFVPLQQTISLILNSEGIGINCINQKALLMSDTKELFPDWATGLEGEAITTFKLSTSFPILEGGLIKHAINRRMASLAALLILAVRALNIEPRPTRIQHVHPAATIQPRSKLARVPSLEARRASGDQRHTRVSMPLESECLGVRRAAARGCGFPDD